jgi:GrpB-like predicted nucleotidyltransferase (UPF0157 family)
MLFSTCADQTELDGKKMAHSVSHDGKAWSNAAEDRVELAASNTAWASQYEAEAAALRSVVPPVNGLRIEHFGSTSIPGVRAKPIIDIMLIHPEPALWPDLVVFIASLGYVYWAEGPRKDRMFFVKGMPPFGSRRTHHVHVRLPSDSAAELSFRDLLRTDPAIAREYERLKEELAERHPNDRDAYTDGKAEFVAKVLGGLPSNPLMQPTVKSGG